jgi:hypothetical protein
MRAWLPLLLLGCTTEVELQTAADEGSMRACPNPIGVDKAATDGTMRVTLQGFDVLTDVVWTPRPGTDLRLDTDELLFAFVEGCFDLDLSFDRAPPDPLFADDASPRPGGHLELRFDQFEPLVLVVNEVGPERVTPRPDRCAKLNPCGGDE